MGLDTESRDEVEKLLLARLADPALETDQMMDLALALSAWDGLSGPGADSMARQFIVVMTKTKDAMALRELAQGLSAMATRMEPKEAAQAATQAAALLTQAMKG